MTNKNSSHRGCYFSVTLLGLVDLFVLFHAVARMCELRTDACGFIGADERQHVLQIHATNGNKSGKNSAFCCDGFTNPLQRYIFFPTYTSE